jgi:hypothetical protein
VVILRPLKYTKKHKITIATSIVGGLIEISVVGVTKRMSIKFQTHLLPKTSVYPPIKPAPEQ